MAIPGFPTHHLLRPEPWRERWEQAAASGERQASFSALQIRQNGRELGEASQRC